MIDYAEDLNYFDTEVNPAKSLGEIQELLDAFGCSQTIVSQGRAGGQLVWTIHFEWREKVYRFTFVPLASREPQKISTFRKQRRTHAEQATYQMGRIAVNFVKAVLTAAQAQPAALFGFQVIQAGNGSKTTAELDLSHLKQLSLQAGAAVIAEQEYTSDRYPKEEN